MNEKVDALLGVTDILSLITVSVTLGFALALRELYNDLIVGDGCEKVINDNETTHNPMLCKKWYMIALRVIVRVAGSFSGAWTAAMIVNLCGVSQMEMLVVGVGGAMGWKLLDSIQSVFYEKIIELIRLKIK